ncbi:unnamed protein product [Amoebophrya sp. A25]|nr:unnamed protein product [Amoebophrya sp. A25]|eukprot:GSA25T00024820001.1
MSGWLNSLFFRKVYTFPNGQEIEEVKELAEGGFAYVSLGKDGKTGDEYAIKKMICQDKKKLDMANREVALLASLPEHKNIVRFYQSAMIDLQTGGGPVRKEIVMLMELCPNGTLLQWITQNGGINKRIPEKDILKPLQDIAEAVFLLHSHKPPVVHQDLKVENIILGNDNNWKLCDFGSWTSDRVDLSNASRQEIMRKQDHYEENVTMMYRPPEMADLYKKEVLHIQIDQWQVGCILYTLMFYKQPFQDCTAPLAIAHAGYDLPADFVPCETYSENLETVLHWLLAKRPDARLNSRNLVRMLWEWEGNPCLDPTEDGNTLVVSPPMAVLEQKREKRRKCHERNQQLHGAVYNPVAVMNLVEHEKQQAGGGGDSSTGINSGGLVTASASGSTSGGGGTSGNTNSAGGADNKSASSSTTAGGVTSTVVAYSDALLTNLGMKSTAPPLRGVAAGKEGVVKSTTASSSNSQQQNGASNQGATTGEEGNATASSSSSAKKDDDAETAMAQFRTKATGPKSAAEARPAWQVQQLAATSSSQQGQTSGGGASASNASSASTSVANGVCVSANNVLDLLASNTSRGASSKDSDPWVADFGTADFGTTSTETTTTQPSSQSRQQQHELSPSPEAGHELSPSPEAGGGGSIGIDPNLDLFAPAKRTGGSREAEDLLFAGVGTTAKTTASGGVLTGTSAPASSSSIPYGNSSGNGTMPPRKNFDALYNVNAFVAEKPASGADDNLFADLEPIATGFSPTGNAGRGGGGDGSAGGPVVLTTGGPPIAASSSGTAGRSASTIPTSTAFMSSPSSGKTTGSPSSKLATPNLKDPFQVDFFTSAATQANKEADKLFDDISLFK